MRCQALREVNTMSTTPLTPHCNSVILKPLSHSRTVIQFAQDSRAIAAELIRTNVFRATSGPKWRLGAARVTVSGRTGAARLGFWTYDCH